MNPPTHFATGPTSTPDISARRRAANRRLAWSLAIFAVLLFLVTLFLHS